MTIRKQQKQGTPRAQRRASAGAPARRRPSAAGGKATRNPDTRAVTGQALALPPECTLSGADTLKSRLARRLQHAGPVTLDVSALQRIDTAGLQLLAAFVRDRRLAGRAVEWRGRADALHSAAALLGLDSMLELTGGCGQ